MIPKDLELVRFCKHANYLADIYLLIVNNGNAKAMSKIFSKLTIKTPERRQWRRSVVFIANFEQISHSSSVSIVGFEQVNAGWEIILGNLPALRCWYANLK